MFIPRFSAKGYIIPLVATVCILFTSCKNRKNCCDHISSIEVGMSSEAVHQLMGTATDTTQAWEEYLNEYIQIETLRYPANVPMASEGCAIVFNKKADTVIRKYGFGVHSK